MRQPALVVVLCAVTIVACGSKTDTAGSNGSNIAEGDAGVDAAAIRAEALSYAREDIACTKDSDCCVVFDGCMNQGYIVGAAQQATVMGLISQWNQAQASNGYMGCNMCIPPPIEVSCGASGFCVGNKLSCGWDQAASVDHCGKVAAPDAGCPTAKPLSTEPKAPGKRMQTVIGCGT